MHSSGVSKAESPVNSDFADRLSGTLVCAGIGASLPREDYLVQAPGLRSQGLRLRQRRFPEIDDVYLT